MTYHFAEEIILEFFSVELVGYNIFSNQLWAV
jgi:hypothetical protein